VTDAGADFARHASGVLARFDQTLAVGYGHARRLAGCLRVGFHGLTLVTPAARLVTDFAAKHPDVEVQWRELGFPRREERGTLGDLDAAIMWSPVPALTVRRCELHREPRVAVLPAGHPLADRDRLRVADILGETFAGRETSTDERWAGFWQLDDERGSPAAATRPRARTTEELMGIVASGAGIATAPRSVAAAYRGAGVVAVPLADADPAIAALCSSAAAANPVLDALLTHAAREHAARGP
jgi:DNA-binding transcriptional LysR family regulator